MIFYKKTLIAAVALGATLSSCQTMVAKGPGFMDSAPVADLMAIFHPLSPEEKARREYITSLPITHPDRSEEFNKIWRNISKHTSALPVSDKRIKIKSDGMLLDKHETSETGFFIRAAAETLKAGHDGFVIVHLDYYSPGPKLFQITPDMNFSSRSWIGNYEDFLDHRNEQNMFSSRGKTMRKVRDGVILMVDKTEFPNRDRFSANEIYLNYMNAKAK